MAEYVQSKYQVFKVCLIIFQFYVFLYCVIVMLNMFLMLLLMPSMSLSLVVHRFPVTINSSSSGYPYCLEKECIATTLQHCTIPVWHHLCSARSVHFSLVSEHFGDSCQCPEPSIQRVSGCSVPTVGDLNTEMPVVFFIWRASFVSYYESRQFWFE